ncbi:MAG: esterase-like activity of phytase family protein [Gammaproteobacteria bacterium]|nr:esterase-like activity of phytase family protein [Gammaproteobacteria bacterium]
MRLIVCTIAATLITTSSLPTRLMAQTDAASYFTRIASFPVNHNLPEGSEPLTETSAEIIDVTPDGMTLVYSDSPLGGIGLVNIANPAEPVPAGFIALNGEPTAVGAVSNEIALAALNTSESYTEPSGDLVALSLLDGTETTRCELGGQPDSIAIAPDGSFVAVAIENERDEDLNDGVIPQMPAGFVVMYPLQDGTPVCDLQVVADVTGLAAIAGDDPEPEFLDINEAGMVAVTLQENNHIVVLDGKSGEVKSHFSAGMVDLVNVDLDEERALTFDGSQPGRLREPDAVQWLDNQRLATSNEGDYNGGSRGFTIFSVEGDVLHESGLDFEYRVARAGHYPEKRSGNKGVEPEGMEVGTFGDDTWLFILAERASVIGAYKDREGAPEFVQLLPSALGPEGAVAMPSRNLLAIANEVDLGEDNGPRSHITLYELGADAPTYPQLVSDNDDAGRPIGWGALSGLAADAEVAGRLYAVNDSFYAMQPTIFTIDATQTPARITDATRVTRAGQTAQLLDLEGIAVDGEGGFWLASEGRRDRLIPHALYHVNSDGEIQEQHAFPEALVDVERRFGSEGVTVLNGKVWIAIQREWRDDEKGMVKLLRFDPAEKTWAAVHYPLDAGEQGWVGLSEIVAHQGKLLIVERDNQIGENAKIKRLYRVELDGVEPAVIGGDQPLPVVTKNLAYDFLSDMSSFGGYVVDKIEGFTIDASGTAYAVTDNDGVDDSNGETLFFKVLLEGES